jgi:Zn-dependent protease
VVSECGFGRVFKYHRQRMFIEMLKSDPRFFFAVVITVVVSITIHELAHGVVAVWLGDRTPIETGHMTLNPAVHMGLFSVIALLVAGIAWGQMPVNPARLRGRYGDALVSLAGPASNVLLALIALTSLGLWFRFDGDPMQPGTPTGNLQYLLRIFGFANLNLALFNLIPIPPLDGSRVLANLSNAYGSIVEHLRTSGASMAIFLIVFSVAGSVTFPAAQKASLFWLRTVSGMDLVMTR